MMMAGIASMKQPTTRKETATAIPMLDDAEVEAVCT
jgi:hypothetical protein